MDKNEIKMKIYAGEFAENNGKIVRTMNILEGDYVDLDVIKNVLTAVRATEFYRSIVYLSKARYIDIRDKMSKVPLTAEEAKMAEAEATLTALGIRIAMGFTRDEAVEI